MTRIDYKKQEEQRLARMGKVSKEAGVYTFCTKQDEVTVYNRFGEREVIYRDEIRDYLNSNGFASVEEMKANHRRAK